MAITRVREARPLAASWERHRGGSGRWLYAARHSEVDGLGDGDSDVDDFQVSVAHSSNMSIVRLRSNSDRL